MAASRRSRRAQAPIKILFCAALFVASFVVYWMGISGYEQVLSASKTGGINDLVHRPFPSSPPSTLDSYATPESAYIEPPAVQGGTSYASDGTSAALSTLDSYTTPNFREILEEGKRAGEIAKAKKEATQSQAAPPRVSEASPKDVSPPDADLTLAGASGAGPSDLSVAAFQRPAVPGPAVRVPALQGPAFPVPAFQGPAFPAPAFRGPAFPVPAFQGPTFK